MSVHQLKDGRWIVKIYDAEKKSKFKWEYFGRGSIAESKARARDADLDFKKTKPRTESDQGPMFHELAGDYIIHRNFSETSEKQCKLRLFNTVIPILGQIPALLISFNNLDRYIRERKKTVKMTTIRREITDVKAVLNWAVKRRPPLIPMNPIRDYPLPQSDDAIISPPTKAEISAILKHANERLTRAIKLAWYTGLRPGPVELYSLCWPSILWDTKAIKIVSAHKGGPKLREVPIHNDFLPELKLWYDKDNNQFGPIIHDKGIAVANLKYTWEITKKKAGITRILRLYSIRHWYATTAIEAGCDYKTLSEVMGSSPETLRKYYQHVSGAARIALVSNMPKLPDNF
jgi:integrase